MSIKLLKPVVVSTWDNGIRANAAAWEILMKNGRALDAVEAGANVTEGETDCCVGLGAYPDREGKVTLDASIMDEFSNCGSVAYLRRIKNPVSVARKLMETTAHVFLAGDGAQLFALQSGFELEPERLSPAAETAYQKWLEDSKYEPLINIENLRLTERFPEPPQYLDDGKLNHDTMGIIALDRQNNLSGACTTSGMAFKMQGRVGDSPIIGAGLFVDNEIGAAVCSGLGEEAIRICGTHLIIELIRFGYTPENACAEAVARIVKRNPEKAKGLQVGFIALTKQGEVGTFSVQKGFTYSVTDSENPEGKIHHSKSFFA